MKLTITKCILLGLLAAGCGSLEERPELIIDMYGVSKAPNGAQGDRDPAFQNYQLLQVALVHSDGVTLTKLFAGEDQRIFRVVDSPQNIFSRDLTDLERQSFEGLRVVFAPEVTGGDKTQTDLSFTLSEPAVQLGERITFQKAKGFRVEVVLNWGNTVADGVMTEPGIEIERY